MSCHAVRGLRSGLTTGGTHAAAAAAGVERLLADLYLLRLRHRAMEEVRHLREKS